jgi:hypothetical protein
MNDLFSKQRPYFTAIMLVTLGFYLVIIPDLFPSVFAHYNVFFNEVRLVTANLLILIGVLMFFYKNTNGRLEAIEKSLEIGSDKSINAKWVSVDENAGFLNQLRKNQYIYKASIYLPNLNIETLIFLRNLLSAVKLDSKVRILIQKECLTSQSIKNLEEITSTYKEKIDLRVTEYKAVGNLQITILDTKIWVQTNFDSQIGNHLVFSLSSYDNHGKTFLDFFNNIWETSSPIF